MTYHPRKLHGGETDDVITNGELATCHTASSACITWFNAKKKKKILRGYVVATDCIHVFCAALSLYRENWMALWPRWSVFTVYCAVRTGSLSKNQFNVGSYRIERMF